MADDPLKTLRGIRDALDAVGIPRLSHYLDHKARIDRQVKATGPNRLLDMFRERIGFLPRAAWIDTDKLILSPDLWESAIDATLVDMELPPGPEVYVAGLTIIPSSLLQRATVVGCKGGKVLWWNVPDETDGPTGRKVIHPFVGWSTPYDRLA